MITKSLGKDREKAKCLPLNYCPFDTKVSVPKKYQVLRLSTRKIFFSYILKIIFTSFTGQNTFSADFAIICLAVTCACMVKKRHFKGTVSREGV